MPPESQTEADKAQKTADHVDKQQTQQDAVVDASYRGTLESVCNHAPNTERTIVIVNNERRAEQARKLLEARRAPADKIKVVVKPNAEVPCWNRMADTVMAHDHGRKPDEKK